MFEDFDYERLSSQDATQKLKDAKTFLESQSFRRYFQLIEPSQSEIQLEDAVKINPNPQKKLSLTWISSITNLLIYQILDDHSRRFEYNRYWILFLIGHPAITFRDNENPDRLLINQLNEHTFLVFIKKNPTVTLRVFEKCADALKTDVHVALVVDVLEIIAEARLSIDNKDYVSKVLELSLYKALKDVDDRNFVLAANQYRRQSVLPSGVSYLYVAVWEQFHSYFFQDDYFEGEDFIRAMEIRSAMNREKCCSHVCIMQTTDELIMTNFILHNNPFYSNRFYQKKYVSKFLTSLSMSRIENLFDNEGFMNEFCETFEKVYFEKDEDTKKHLMHIVIEICRLSKEKDYGPILSDALQKIQSRTGNWTSESIEFVLEMESAAGRRFSDISGDERKRMTNILHQSDVSSCYTAILLDVKSRFPETNRRRKFSMDYSLLEFGLSEFKKDYSLNETPLSEEQQNELFDIFLISTNRSGGLFRLVDSFTQPFGGINWSWNDFSNLLKLLATSGITLINKYSFELEDPEETWNFFSDYDGCRFFINCLDYSLSWLLETLSVAKMTNSSYFVGFEFESEEISVKRKYRSILHERERTIFHDDFKNNIRQTFKDYIEMKNNKIFDYIFPLVKMFCNSMEVTKYEQAYPKLFDYFYVPAVKGLLIIAPLQAIQMIVAFCRSDLKLNHKATFSKNRVLQECWGARRQKQTVDKCIAHFEKFEDSLQDLLSGNVNVHNTDDILFLLLENYVSAVVNEFELYRTKEVADYMVVVSCYSQIKSANISRHSWERLSDNQAQDFLFNVGDDNGY